MAKTPVPSLLEAAAVWAKIGLLSFGGPAAQIALMHRMIVEERGWAKEKPFLEALSFCMLLPGPEAMQLATYLGWRLHGVPGGLAAGLLFVLPGALIILALALAYALFGSVPIVQSLFLGVKSAVLAIVVEALLRVAQKALKSVQSWSIAALAFLALFAFELPFPVVIAIAGLWGGLRHFTPERVDGEDKHQPRRIARTLQTIAFWLTLWWAPLLIMQLWTAPAILTDIGLFFSKLAVVTFGGAYAVLTYMAQDVVTAFGWLEAQEMVDGLGLAETTPGPLILVTEFVAFLAAYKTGGLWLGLMAASMALWVTFIPCFLWIFVSAPYLDQITAQPRLRGVLNAITAAVVGVILNLFVWFAMHVLFAELARPDFGFARLLLPEPASVDWRACILALAAGWMLFAWRWPVLVVLPVTALGGWVLSLPG